LSSIGGKLMDQQIIELHENHEALHGGKYYFIIENNRLIHISHYALKKKMRKRLNLCCYYVDFNRIKNKKIMEVISYSKNGLSNNVYIFSAEDLLNKEINKKEEPITIINNYEIVHLRRKEKKFLDEWNNYYRPMLNYIRNENKWKIEVADLIKIHINNDLKYPISFLIPYNKNIRTTSLNVITKLIHQIWIITKILKELSVEDPLENLLHLKQGSSIPVAIIGNYAMWYEFNLGFNKLSDIPLELKNIIDKAVELKEKGLTKCLRLRPDVVFTYAKNYEEFIQNPIVKLVIECKNSDYRLWEKDAEIQVKSYAKIFTPEHILITSLKSVPNYVKKRLLNQGIEIIDNVYPGGYGEKELIDYIKHIINKS
jgi:hypothetical protein